MAIAMTPQERADKIFVSCFTAEQLEFLSNQPAFVELSRNILSLSDTLKAVETGERLVKETRNSGNRTDSPLTPKSL